MTGCIDRRFPLPRFAAAARLCLIFSVCCSLFAEPGSAADDWPMTAKDYASTRFSELADINASNIAQLKPAFSFSTGVVRGHEAAPLVVNGTMYIVTPYPNYL